MYLGILGIDYTVPNWAIIITVCAYTLYKYVTWNFDTFTKMGLDGPKPTFPFGTIYPFIKQGIFKLGPIYYKRFHKDKAYGEFMMRRPILNVTDIDMIKEILVKEFPSFENRMTLGKTGDPLMDNSIVALEGQHWKNVRNIISPTFTSGKLKLMVSHINDCARILTDNLTKFTEDGGEFDAKIISEACTMDIIARVAFGLEVDSQREENSDFVKLVRKVFVFNKFNPKVWICMTFPFMVRVFNYFGIPLFPQDVKNFLVGVIENTISQREKDDVNRKDFLQLMLASVNPNATPDRWTKGELSKEDLLAQSILFFLAGFETTASGIAFSVYQLAINQECQRKLQEELDSVMGDSDTVTYDMLQQMTYLDMVVCETLRMHPAAPTINRLCNSDITIGGIHIPAGMAVNMTAYCIHMDEDIYPNPSKYDPERFTKEAKEARHPFAWLPFGAGPRNCIGMRLALLEMKIALAHWFKMYNVMPCDKTENPLILEPFQMKAKNGIKLKLEKRLTK